MSDQPSIAEYAAIGDGRSVALISRFGSIDWLCWPRFDSDAVFAKILDSEKGGHWSIQPRDVIECTRWYRKDTNVLETRFRCVGGEVRVTDFMPLMSDEEVRKQDHLVPEQELVRLIECDHGKVEIDVSYAPRPGFAEHVAPLIDAKKLGLKTTAGGAVWSLHSDLDFSITADVATAHRSLEAGERTALIFAYSSESPAVLPLPSEAPAALRRTVSWWETWSAHSSYDGPSRDVVIRSLLALKLLSFPSSGAFVAAPSTSLPERLGGKLNWDYRYCWLRDSSLIMQVLCDAGYIDEAESFAEWLMHATRLSQPKLKVMYEVYGNPAAKERALQWLSGHFDSKPVNLGNGARNQEQLDTYGEVVAAVAMLTTNLQRVDRGTARVLVGFGKVVCSHWREPDAGIWEVREQEVVHTHSRLLCWLALEKLIRLSEAGLLHGHDVTRFIATRADIRNAIETESWNSTERTYSNRVDRLEVDATLLLLGVFGFESPASERMQSTHRRVLAELDAGGSLLFRNRNTPGEGAFGACGFWNVSFLAQGGGSLADAKQAFESLLTTANDLDLFSEESDPKTGALLGNFPQAFTHVGVVHAAMAIRDRERREQGRAA